MSRWGRGMFCKIPGTSPGMTEGIAREMTERTSPGMTEAVSLGMTEGHIHAEGLNCVYTPSRQPGLCTKTGLSVYVYLLKNS